MKRFLLPLLAALLLAPATVKAVPAPVSAPSTVASVTPVDDLIKILNPIINLTIKIEEVGEENITLDQTSQLLELYGKLQNLQKTQGNYRLTDTDREELLNWVKTTTYKMTGEKMTAADMAKSREELQQYKTLNDLMNDMNQNDVF